MRVSLRYIKPPIWRRFLVPDNWLLADLHPVLVAVMGSGGRHLHAFRWLETCAALVAALAALARRVDLVCFGRGHSR